MTALRHSLAAALAGHPAAAGVVVPDPDRHVWVRATPRRGLLRMVCGRMGCYAEWLSSRPDEPTSRCRSER